MSTTRIYNAVYCLNDEYMMDIKLNKQNVPYYQLLMFVLSKNRNNTGPVPPHRQGSGGPIAFTCSRCQREAMDVVRVKLINV